MATETEKTDHNLLDSKINYSDALISGRSENNVHFGVETRDKIFEKNAPDRSSGPLYISPDSAQCADWYFRIFGVVVMKNFSRFFVA